MDYRKSSIDGRNPVLHVYTINFHFPQAKTNLDNIMGELERENDKVRPATLGGPSRDHKFELYLRTTLSRCSKLFEATRHRIIRSKSIAFLNEDDMENGGKVGTSIMLWTTAVAMACFLQRNILYKRTHLDYYILQTTNTQELVYLSVDYFDEMESLLAEPHTAKVLMATDLKNVNILTTSKAMYHLKEAVFRQSLVLDKLPIYRQGVGYEVHEGYRMTASTLRFSPSYWVMPAIKVACETNRPLEQTGLAAPREVLGSRYGERLNLDMSDMGNRASKMKDATTRVVENFSNKIKHKCGQLMEWTNTLTLLTQALQIVTDGKAEWTSDFHKIAHCTNYVTAITSVSTEIQDKWMNMEVQKPDVDVYIIRYFRGKVIHHKKYGDHLKALFYERAAVSREQNSPDLLFCDCGDKDIKESLRKTVCMRPGVMKDAIDKHARQCGALNITGQPRLAQKRPISSQGQPSGPPTKRHTQVRQGTYGGPGGGRPPPSTASGNTAIFAHPRMVAQGQRPLNGRRPTHVRQQQLEQHQNRPPPRHNQDQLHYNDDNGYFYDAPRDHYPANPRDVRGEHHGNKHRYHTDN